MSLSLAGRGREAGHSDSDGPPARHPRAQAERTPLLYGSVLHAIEVLQR